jgi:propanediol utilization protein
LKVKSGVAVVERRMKINSQNVGVAARHVLLVRKAIGLLFSPHNNRLKLTAALRKIVRPRSFA